MANNDSIRNRIIKKSYLLILNKGYKGTTIDDILNEAGVSKGSFYYYFASKRDIAKAIIDEIIKEEFLTVWRNVHKGEDPVKNIIKKINMSYDKKGNHYSSTGCPLGNLIVEFSSVDIEFSKKTDSILKMWSSYIRKALDKSLRLGILNANFNPEKVADFLVASMEGCILAAKSSHDKKKLRNCFDSMINYLKSISDN
ncbi:TetR/AcrR family transcriptional regulator [Candidatus Acidulodesulfobacterium sp. H_13]|uniref:TetR/AcrR family transcriptional regulator n=1 Tax=Candidatus Acidulodesulfobacterium sp. H_13 TaxID=3395470 RepID=UPI003AF48580